MEKKVPERKVSLHEEDIFYIYDKRINKCVREDCEGTVKYGLVLKVRVSEEESLNCFDCNKCHMKYSPYPNYVRLQKKDVLKIYNQDEVTARDQKRADDAAKQAAKEARERKNANRKAAGRRNEHRPVKDDNRKSLLKNGNKKPFDGRRTNGMEKKNGEYKPYGERRQQGEYRSYGEKRDFEKRSYQKGSFDVKAKSDNKKNFAGKQPRKSNIIITTGGYQKAYYQNKKKDADEYSQKEY